MVFDCDPAQSLCQRPLRKMAWKVSRAISQRDGKCADIMNPIYKCLSASRSFVHTINHSNLPCFAPVGFLVWVYMYGWRPQQHETYHNLIHSSKVVHIRCCSWWTKHDKNSVPIALHLMDHTDTVKKKGCVHVLFISTCASLLEKKMWLPVSQVRCISARSATCLKNVGRSQKQIIGVCHVTLQQKHLGGRRMYQVIHSAWFVLRAFFEAGLQMPFWRNAAALTEGGNSQRETWEQRLRSKMPDSARLFQG